MNAYLNYILEANAGLLILLLFYKLLLAGETDFRALRLLLLAGVVTSLLFPLIHIGANPDVMSPLSIGRVIPTYWLPEVVVGGEISQPLYQASFNAWKYVAWLYAAGLITVFLVVVNQLRQLFVLMRHAQTYRLDKLRIAESREDKPTFSFFHFIFIGNSDQLSVEEKQQVIRHESVHAREWHSLDILLMNVLKILFWFNPFINTYKKIFIQLHEFQADARAVRDLDVNKYCSLLARVALQSADFSLASHFNQSLTVKRIEMMRTIKSNVKRWKLAAMFATFALLFFFVACQDQVGSEISEIARNSTHALIAPDFIRGRFEQLKKENPDKNYALLELSETGSEKLNDLRMQYGLPNSVEVFRTINGQLATETPLQAQAQTVDGKLVFEMPSGPEQTSGRHESQAVERNTSVEGRRTRTRQKGEQTFVILEFTDQTAKVAQAQEGKIYTVVEHQPEYPGGYDALMSFIKENLRYPLDARQQGIEGTVYASFIVEKEGAIDSVKIIRGISPTCDQEVVRVVKLFPKWKAGMQSGQTVRVRFVLPIKFGLNRSE